MKTLKEDSVVYWTENGEPLLMIIPLNSALTPKAIDDLLFEKIKKIIKGCSNSSFEYSSEWGY